MYDFILISFSDIRTMVSVLRRRLPKSPSPKIVVYLTLGNRDLGQTAMWKKLYRLIIKHCLASPTSILASSMPILASHTSIMYSSTSSIFYQWWLIHRQVWFQHLQFCFYRLQSLAVHGFSNLNPGFIDVNYNFSNVNPGFSNVKLTLSIQTWKSHDRQVRSWNWRLRG